MPAILNTNGAKAGSIYRIKLENFITYKEVELYPGLYLNMIIGPNGTGKSTFVCALIIGLCGNIASIGRSKKISGYIRSGCQEATIEIELYQQRGKPNVKITRVFNMKDQSKWYINNKTESLQNVKVLIDKFDIKVDNLCQMLPQDRVKDFAVMTPHILLQRTLSAIGGQKRVDELEELKNWHSKQSELDNKLQKIEKRRQDLIKENEVLQGRIDTINRKKEIENELKVCECKKLWLEEATAKSQCQKYNKEKDSINKKITSNKKNVQTLEDSLKNVRDEIKLLETEKLKMNSSMNTLTDQIIQSLESVKTCDVKIKEGDSWIQEIERRLLNEVDELKEAQVCLDRLRMDLKQALVNGDETKMTLDLTNVRSIMNELRRDKNALTQKRDEIQNELDRSIFPEIVRCERKITSLEDVDRRRLQTLQIHSKDTYEALRWFRDNKTLFQDRVCEPMMLEIKFADRRYARYLEATVKRNDLIAFTFCSPSDMNLFLKKVRGELRLKQVNAVCSPQQSEKFTSPDIREISHFGFHKYLVDTFEADEMIVRYLCRNYNLHRVPIGNDYTYNNSGRVDPNITLFFSDNNRFTVRVSKYSGEKSSSMSKINDPKLLADSVDVAKIEVLKQELSEHRRTEQRYRDKMMEIGSSIAARENQYDKKLDEETAIQKHIHCIRELSSKIGMQEKVVLEKSRPSVDVQKEKDKCIIDQRDHVNKQVKLHRDLAELMMNMHRLVLLCRVVSMALTEKRESIVDQEKQLLDLNKELSEFQKSLTKVTRAQEALAEAAACKLEEALRSSDNKRPEHPQFPQRELYQQLPDDAQLLEERRNELRTRMDCMGAGDFGDLTTYENNKKEIEKLMSTEKADRHSKKQLAKSMEKTKVEWIKFMNELIENINLRFRNMFEKLGFGGEVQLKQGASEDDFSSYGVAIMVKFREGQALSELTPHEQSGGERSISTAVYLLALQHLAAASFRCVDEINQGMDPSNERKMFEFLVDVTTEAGGQYFLLTPKLLTDLKYNEKVTVHTIMNGRWAMQCDQWQMNKFLAKLGSYSHQM